MKPRARKPDPNAITRAAKVINPPKPPPKVLLTLVGLDGNAFALMGAFKHAAERQGWPAPSIKAVLDDCMSGDYDHLLSVLMANCEDADDEEDEG